MGWTEIGNVRWTKKMVINELMGENNTAPGWEVITQRIVENNIWYVCKHPKGHKMIGLYVLDYTEEHGWFYLSTSETCGPNQLDCPVSFIKMCDPAKSEFAKEWRDEVIQRANKRKAPRFHGEIVALYGKQFRLLAKMPNPRDGWRSECTETGKIFRLSLDQLVKSETVSTPAESVPAGMFEQAAIDFLSL